mmetsp:Transcript_14293/g.25867  ORF Transcript_14293/g.25867 Transcript_14293/m.25867 type:complete len:103 (+) Transcript_14293:48-356(+)
MSFVDLLLRDIPSSKQICARWQIEAIEYGMHGHHDHGHRLQKTRGFGSFQCRHSLVARVTIPTAFQDETSRCNVFFQSNPTRYGTRRHVSEETIRGNENTLV